MTVIYINGHYFDNVRRVIKRAKGDKDTYVVADTRRYEGSFLNPKRDFLGGEKKEIIRTVKNYFLLGELPAQISMIKEMGSTPALFMYGTRDEILTDLANGLDQAPQLAFGNGWFPALTAHKSDGKLVCGISSFEGKLDQKDNWVGGDKVRVTGNGFLGLGTTIEHFQWWNIRPGLYGTATSNQAFTIKASFFLDFFRTLTAD